MKIDVEKGGIPLVFYKEDVQPKYPKDESFSTLFQSMNELKDEDWNGLLVPHFFVESSGERCSSRALCNLVYNSLSKDRKQCFEGVVMGSKEVYEKLLNNFTGDKEEFEKKYVFAVQHVLDDYEITPKAKLLLTSIKKGDTILVLRRDSHIIGVYN